MNNTPKSEDLNRFVMQAPSHFSFEFFPPKSDAAKAALWKNIETLAPLAPDYVSVTYGAGGTTRETTYETVKAILDKTNLTPAVHLTCVGHSRDEIHALAQSYWEAGVKQIVALRGDPPKGTEQYTPHPNGYAYADDLVSGLLEIAPFEIMVAAYPETHPTAPGAAFDLEHLKRKIDNGAKEAVCQYCFDTETFLRFNDRAREAGITAPITPGVMVMSGWEQCVRFSKMCGASIPDWMRTLFHNADENPVLRDQLAVYIAAEQCRQLRAEGIDNFHIYTLNRADLTLALCRLIGIQAK